MSSLLLLLASSFLSSSCIHPHHCSAYTTTPPLPFLPSLHQEHFCSVYSPKLQLPNKVKPNRRSLGSELSHPIWKSCFFPCGPGVLFTGDSRAGNGTGHCLDGHAHGFYAYQANSQECFEFHIYEDIPCDLCHI